jgi:hypothetical protein
MERSSHSSSAVLSVTLYNDQFFLFFPFVSLQTAFHIPATTENSPHREQVLTICHTSDNTSLCVSQVYDYDIIYFDQIMLVYISSAGDNHGSF